MKIHRLLLVSFVILLLGTVFISCTEKVSNPPEPYTNNSTHSHQDNWGSYTLNDQVTMEYPLGWYVDTWEASPSSVRFMLPGGDGSLAHTRIFVTIWDEPEDLDLAPSLISYVETVKLSNGTEYTGIFNQNPEFFFWDAMYLVMVDNSTFLDIQAFIPYNSEYESSDLKDICIHIIASMRTVGAGIP